MTDAKSYTESQDAGSHFLPSKTIGSSFFSSETKSFGRSGWPETDSNPPASAS